MSAGLDGGLRGRPQCADQRRHVTQFVVGAGTAALDEKDLSTSRHLASSPLRQLADGRLDLAVDGSPSTPDRILQG